MKVYQKKPQRELIIFKPDSADQEYEFWVIQPVYVGTARKAGTQRVITEDRQQFTNLSSAGRYLLDKMGDAELAAQQPLFVRRDTSKVEIVGLDLVEVGKWREFCKMRGLDVRNTEAMNKHYFLDQTEAKKLGVK